MPIEMIVVIAVYIVCWQGYELRRRLTGFGQVVLLIVVLAAVVNPSVQRLAESGWLGDVDTATARFIGTLIVTVDTIALYMFRLTVDGASARSGRVVRTASLGAGVLGLEIVLFVTATADGLSMLYGRAAFDHARGAVYFAFVGLFFFIVRALVLVWIVRSTRDAGTALKLGVRVAGAGLLIAGVVSLFRSVPPFVALVGGPLVAAPSWVLFVASVAGTPLVIAGLSFPLAVGRARAFVDWVRHRRAHDRIEPLWRISRTAFPEVVLASNGASPPLSHRLHRRRAECLDALHLLRAEKADLPAASQGARAAERLRHAVARFENDDPDGISLSAVISGDHRGPDLGAASTGVSHRDHEVLERLADLIETESNPHPGPRHS